MVEKPTPERQSHVTFAAVLRLGLRLHLKRTHVAHRVACLRAWLAALLLGHLARDAFSEVAASGATVPCRAASAGAALQLIAHCLRCTDSQRERPPRLATDQRAGALVILKAGQAGRVTPKWWGGETTIVWARVAHPAHECLPEEVGAGWVAIDAATSTFDSGAAQGAAEEVLTRLRVALLARPLASTRDARIACRRVVSGLSAVVTLPCGTTCAAAAASSTAVASDAASSTATARARRLAAAHGTEREHKHKAN